jgi:hypothetical protein
MPNKGGGSSRRSRCIVWASVPTRVRSAGRRAVIAFSTARPTASGAVPLLTLRSSNRAIAERMSPYAAIVVAVAALFALKFVLM